MNSNERVLDRSALRVVLGKFVTGVAVITAVSESGQLVGVTSNSFASVSLDPPLILWSLDRRAGTYPVFASANSFAVNILSLGQVELSRRFAQKGVDRFVGTNFRRSDRGNALLAGCTAYLECRTLEQLPGGDHTIFLARVEDMAATDEPPLVFGAGAYLDTRPLLAPSLATHS